MQLNYICCAHAPRPHACTIMHNASCPYIPALAYLYICQMGQPGCMGVHAVHAGPRPTHAILYACMKYLMPFCMYFKVITDNIDGCIKCMCFSGLGDAAQH